MEAMLHFGLIVDEIGCSQYKPLVLFGLRPIHPLIFPEALSLIEIVGSPSGSCCRCRTCRATIVLRKSGTRTSGLKILQLLEKESNNFHILLEKLTQSNDSTRNLHASFPTWFQQKVYMSSGGANPPRPLSHDSSGKETTAKKRRYVVRLLPPRDSLPSSTPSSSSVSMPVRPPDVTPTPSPPPTKARPSSSHVNARGPSLAPTSTPSPSSVDAREPSLRKLVWRPEEENEIKKAFNSKASHRLSVMFRDAQNENKRPYWIRDHDWNDTLSHWNAPEYRSKCAQTKKNWASEKGGCMHTDEVFQQTHSRNDTGQFVDDRFRQTHERPLSSVGPKHKGHLYGTRDLAHTFKCKNDGFMQHTQGSSSRAEDVIEINRLREELCQ
ncbi:hypothetical protein JHK87_050030 [Glycine soja]|nr:hypothetical protein JHK87_050030 [Glycine soja]